MNLVLELNGKSFKIDLPERVATGQPFMVKAPGLEASAVLLRHAGVLVLKDSSGLEHHAHIRRAVATRFAGEPETQVRAELLIAGKAHYLRATVRPDLPGQDQPNRGAGAREQVIRSQITGKILKLLVQAGDVATAGQALLVIEAMKMENRVFSQVGGIVASVSVKEGDAVQTGKELLRITP